MGRSNAEPSFFTSAGARLIVTLRQGNSKPQFFIADITRSFDSRTVPSGSPTMAKLGSMSVISASMSISIASIPIKAIERIFDSMTRTPSANRACNEIEYREEKENNTGEPTLITNSNSFECPVSGLISLRQINTVKIEMEEGAGSAIFHTAIRTVPYTAVRELLLIVKI